jgi:hypothetical protein
MSGGQRAWGEEFHDGQGLFVTGLDSSLLALCSPLLIGRIPRCCPGLLLLPRQASAAGSLVSDEKWTCAPGLHWVRRCCRPLARLFALRTMMKLGFSVGSAPTPSLPQREVLLLHHEKHLKCILRPDWLRLRKVALRARNCRSAAGRSHRHGLVHNEEC